MSTHNHNHPIKQHSRNQGRQNHIAEEQNPPQLMEKASVGPKTHQIFSHWILSFLTVLGWFFCPHCLIIFLTLCSIEGWFGLAFRYSPGWIAPRTACEGNNAILDLWVPSVFSQPSQQLFLLFLLPRRSVCMREGGQKLLLNCWHKEMPFCRRQVVSVKKYIYFILLKIVLSGCG